MRLEHDIAVVTGAGSGMGRAIASLFASEGANVIAADINLQGVEDLIAEMDASDTPHGEIIPCQANVSVCAEVEAMIDLAIERYGRLDILMNNAGIIDKMMPVADITDDLWERVLSVNLNSVMYACRHAVPLMVKQENGGRIVNMSSLTGLYAGRAGVAYTTSKHGVIAITRNVGFMYAQHNIRCNAICPGNIETSLSANLSDWNQFGLERACSGLGANPRNGSPEEVAQVALFLASPESSFVNGTAITVDGGWSAF